MRHRVVYGGREFTGQQVGSVQMRLATSLICSGLEANVLTATVKSSDPTLTDFTQNTPVTYYHQGRQTMIGYLQSVERVGAARYKLRCTSAIGLLIQRPHAGGIYSGQTAQEIIADICGSIPFRLKNNMKLVKLYGWLPYSKPPGSSARDNLAKVLFAIGATVKTDMDGVLRIEGLWDGMSGEVPSNKIYRGPAVTSSAPVSGVSVTEHQYTPGEEEQQLFDGTTQEGEVITFSEPMHTLTASGFTILSSGANWAKLSAGSGVLTGKKYIHNTRRIFKTISGAKTSGAENVKDFSDNTLVSLVNSNAVAARLANYYGCLETIKNDIVLDRQSPGDVVHTVHPYDKIPLNACIKSLEVMSGASILRATAEELVAFAPLANQIQGTFDARELLTGSGEWTVPDGVTSYTRVLIGGGTGGFSGKKGEDGNDNPSTSDEKSTWWSKTYCKAYAKIAKGGDGGQPGSGGKILVETITNAVPGTKVPYSCGEGGIGADFNAEDDPENSTPGTPGSDTTMGESSSAFGSQSVNGFTDPTTGECFATYGLQGIAGGDGGGNPDPDTYKTTNDKGVNEVGVGVILGASVTDEDGNVWAGGSMYMNEASNTVQVLSAKKGASADGKNYMSIIAHSLSGCSGGAAAGAAGQNGNAPIQPSASLISNSGSSYLYGSATGPKGADGATAVLIPKTPVQFGQGGRGGYGGGAGASAGMTVVIKSYSGEKPVDYPSKYYYGTQGPGTGGNGGKGGPGAPGCIILFYQAPIKIKSGTVTDQKGRFILDRTGRIVIV